MSYAATTATWHLFDSASAMMRLSSDGGDDESKMHRLPTLIVNRVVSTKSLTIICNIICKIVMYVYDTNHVS